MSPLKYTKSPWAVIHIFFLTQIPSSLWGWMNSSHVSSSCSPYTCKLLTQPTPLCENTAHMPIRVCLAHWLPISLPILRMWSWWPKILPPSLHPRTHTCTEPVHDCRAAFQMCRCPPAGERRLIVLHVDLRTVMRPTAHTLKKVGSRALVYRYTQVYTLLLYNRERKQSLYMHVSFYIYIIT